MFVQQMFSVTGTGQHLCVTYSLLCLLWYVDEQAAGILELELPGESGHSWKCWKVTLLSLSCYMSRYLVHFRREAAHQGMK